MSAAITRTIVRTTLRDNADDTIHGIVLVAIAYLAMTIGDVASILALPVAGVAGAMVWRGVFGALTVGGLSVMQGSWRRLRPVRSRLVLLRCVLHSFVSITWYVAWEEIPFADSYAVGFTAPLLMTFLAIPILGETIRWRRTLSTSVGFLGVLLMIRPGGALWTPAVALLLLGIVAMAISRIMTRLLSTTESPECLSFWLLAFHVPAGLLTLLWLPSGSHVLPWSVGLGIATALAALGIFNGLGHWIQSRAYALAPVSALAPYEYTTLPYGIAAGYLLFRQVPEVSTLAGAAIVAAAGLYNLHRERVRRAEQMRADHAAKPPSVA